MGVLKIYYFSIEDGVEPPLKSTLERLEKMTLDQRTFEVGAAKIRLDDIARKNVGGKECWGLRFMKYRNDNWPAVAEAGVVAKDLPLADHQDITEETSCLICPEKGRLVLQYNHFGVRGTKIAAYLNTASEKAGNMVLLPVMDNGAWEKFNKKKTFTKVTANIEGVTDADVQIFDGAGIGSALKAANDAKASRFQFTFSVDARLRSEKVEAGFVRRLVDGVMRRGGDEDSLVVAGREGEEDAAEVIDLLESRKVSKFDTKTIGKTAGKRFVPEDVYNVLAQCLQGWQ